MVLLISYDLNGHERPQSYAAVKKYIETHAASSIRPLYSQWLIETTSTPQQWVDALQNNNLIDPNDRLFICQIVIPHQGLLDRTVWEWLTPRV